MKKLKMSLIFVTIGTLILSGCSGAVSQTNGNSAKKEPTKLVIAARGGSHVTAMESVKADFEKEKNVKIQILGLESDDLKKKIALDSKNKTGAYDLIMADDPWMPEFTQAKIFENLTKSGFKADSDFIKPSLDLGKAPYATGDLYALPFAGNVQFLFYNKDLLKNNGQDIPKSWEDVLNTASKINSKESKPGYVIRGEQGNPILSDFLPLLWAYGGDVMDKDFKGTLNTKEAKDALQMYVDLLKVGANYKKDDIVTSVSTGKAAMSLGWPSWYISNDGSKADYAPIPSKRTSSSKEYATGMIGNWMMGVTANSQNKELAKEFLTYITSSDVQKKMIQYGGVPTRSSVCKDAELLKKYPYLETLRAATENSVARPRTPKWSAIEVAVGAELSSVVTGKKSIDEGLQAANEAINNIMK